MSKLLHVRLDDEAHAALAAIQDHSAESASEAVRHALVSFARELRRRELAEEAAELMADTTDRRVVADTREFFGDVFDAAR